MAAPGSAITNGVYDGNDHPYVGVVSNGRIACSGTLLSPRVFLTAAHCAVGMTSKYGTNADGSPVVHVSFDPNLGTIPPELRTFVTGAFYGDAYNPNLPSNSKDPDTHDVAIVLLDSGVSLPRYGALPSAGLVDGLAMNAPIDIVGFGVQDLLRGGGQPQPDTSSYPFRIAAGAQLIAANDQTSSRFMRLKQNLGGICFGDSGGPDLLPGTNVVLAINSTVSNNVCNGLAYSYRVDTASALDWIRNAAASHGASL